MNSRTLAIIGTWLKVALFLLIHPSGQRLLHNPAARTLHAGRDLINLFGKGQRNMCS